MIKPLYFLFIFSLILSNKIYGSSVYPGFKEEYKPRHKDNNVSVPLSRLKIDPLTLVNQCVNVISGDFIESQVDFEPHGIQPLALERSYRSSDQQLGSLYHGWHFNLFNELVMKKSERNNVIDTYVTLNEGGYQAIFESHRMIYEFDKPLTISKEMLKKGVTNTTGEMLSGRTNCKNMMICKDTLGRMVLTNGAGVTKYFPIENDITKPCRLTQENRPNGNYLLYEYNGSLLQFVSSRNIFGKLINSFLFQYLPFDQFEKNPRLDVIAMDERKVRYYFQKMRDSKYFLSRVEKPEFPSESYFYTEANGFPQLQRKENSKGGFLQIGYYQLGQNPLYGNTITINDENDLRFKRVRFLEAPVGRNNAPIVTHTFDYTINSEIKGAKRNILNGVTTVRNAYGVPTRYIYDSNQRLTTIEKCKRDNILYSRERFFWGDNDSKDSTNLVSQTLAAEDDSLHVAKTFQYDEQGNVTEERLYGNLSGENQVGPLLLSGGIPSNNGCEYFKKEYYYSKDGLNLLLYEGEGTQAISYVYKPGTELLLAKYKIYNNTIYERFFYEYNENAVLSKAIHDDGTALASENLFGVTERHITAYTLRPEYPIGLPEVVEEKYLDITTGIECLDHKLINTYDVWGRLTTQAHYDSANQYAYTLSWEYDVRGNVLKEVDAIGNVISRQYDAEGNLIYEKGPHKNSYKTFAYDLMNRLITVDEFHSDGVHLSTSHNYDYCDNRISTKDIYGNETNYDYDPFGRVTKITRPGFLSAEGVLCRSEENKEYDILGNVTYSTDAKGACTKKSYNILGKTVCTIDPDSSLERNYYHFDGRLRKSLHKDGTETRYYYDFANRVIRKERYSQTGDLLSTTSSKYNAFHLLAEADSSGTYTHYDYYPNGKLRSRAKGDMLTMYEYDALGREAKTKEYYGSLPEDVIVSIKSYDLLNRVILEQIEDYQGNIQRKTEYGYDGAGNCISSAVYGSSTIPAITQTAYNSRNQPTKITDPEGKITTIFYRYDFHNVYGQCVPCKKITDPSGVVTTITEDAQGNVVQILIHDSKGNLLKKQDMRYDGNGNKVLLIETLISKNHEERELVTQWTYDAMNRMTSCTEAVHCPEQKSTFYTYNLSGKKETITKADGVTISLAYDLFGHLSHVNASDDTIAYSYEYDKNGNLIKAVDHVNNTSVQRTYDPNNRMLSESLGNGFTFSYSYDRLGRPLTVTLSDQTVISYLYHGLNASEVRYGNYTHQYLLHDLSGNLLSSKLIGKAGKLTSTYDVSQRIDSIECLCWKELITSYNLFNKILLSTVYGKRGSTSCTYTYDDLGYLKTEEGAVSHQYLYDSLGNRLEKDGKSSIYNALNNLVDDSTKRYAYDPNGNVTSEGEILYQYDALDRLTSMINGKTRTQYIHDALNRRISKVMTENEGSIWQRSVTTNYLYLGENEIGAAQEDKIIELRIPGINKAGKLGRSIAIQLGSKTYAPIYDHDDSIVNLVEADSGRVFETYRYSMFGELLFAPSRNPWLFLGKRYDVELGKFHFGPGYYDAATSQWMKPKIEL